MVRADFTTGVLHLRGRCTQTQLKLVQNSLQNTLISVYKFKGYYGKLFDDQIEELIHKHYDEFSEVMHGEEDLSKAL